MPVIRHPNELYTVIVTVDAESDVMPDLEAHARAGLTLFRDFVGFVAGALHKSEDGGRLIQYVQWETESHHLECVNDSRWDSFPSTQRFMAIVDSGRAQMDVRTYRVLAAVDGPPVAERARD
jgi:hypothetical protein